MTPEEARRIVSACGLLVAEPKKDITPKKECTGRVSTSEIVHALGIKHNSVIAFLKKHKFRPIKMLNTYSQPLMWTKKAFEFIKSHHKSLTEKLPDGVEWITAKEALEILGKSRTWLFNNATSVRRLVNGRLLSYYDKQEIQKLWQKSKLS